MAPHPASCSARSPPLRIFSRWSRWAARALLPTIIASLKQRCAASGRRIAAIWASRSKMRSGHGVDLGLPWEDRFAAGPCKRHVAILRDLAPALARGNGWPVRHAVLGSGVERPRGCEVGKVGDHGDRIVNARTPPLPGENALSFLEIDVDELGVVDGERRGARAKMNETGDVVEHAPAPGLLQAIEVHGVDLFLRMHDG